MYQLRLFHTKNYQGFNCVNCIELPDEFREMVKTQGESMVDTYKREIKACENIIMLQKNNESKLISGLKKLTENQKAANQEKELVTLFEWRFNELEKKIDDTQTSMKEIKKSGKLIKQNIKSSTKENYAGIVKSTENPIIPDFQKILCDEKLKEIDEKRQQELRKPNIMVFGRYEISEVQKHQK